MRPHVHSEALLVVTVRDFAGFAASWGSTPTG
jgi:hypothetical protein